MKIENKYLDTTVYALKFDNEVVYVGKTEQGVKVRIQNHFTNAFTERGRLRNTCPKLYEFIRNNPDKGRYSVLIIGQYAKEEALQVERESIEKYKTRSKANKKPGVEAKRLNIAPGGIVRGKDHYSFGKVPIKAVEASIKARKGKPLSEEHKRNQRAGHAANRANSKRIKKVKCDQTNKVWNSLSECADNFEVSCGAVLWRIKNKERKRAARSGNKLGEYTFSYL